MLISLNFFISKASGSSSSSSGEEASHPAPEPYSFAYSANTDDGATSTREETGDRDGRVTGKTAKKKFL